MRFVYLEAGSGAKEHVPCDIVRTVVRNVEIPVIVGGGIRTPEEAKKIAEAGASAIVTGTVCETDPSGESVKRIIEGIAQVNNLKHHNTTVPAVF
jgi:geranylgeranylglyceryl phosphate synthase family protein